MLSCIADVLYACVIGPSFISFPEVEITVIVIVRLLLSMWFYNSEYGDAHMRGWLFREGNWSWGCVITWHIVDLGCCISYRCLNTSGQPIYGSGLVGQGGSVISY